MCRRVLECFRGVRFVGRSGIRGVLCKRRELGFRGCSRFESVGVLGFVDFCGSRRPWCRAGGLIDIELLPSWVLLLFEFWVFERKGSGRSFHFSSERV